MPLIELTAEEMKAIDTACMIVNEHLRLGRKKLRDYIEEDGDAEGAAQMGSAISEVNAARVTLRGLIARAKETNDA